MSTEYRSEILPLSSLNAFIYCERRFYYEFVQGDMLVNEFVLEGTLLHQRVDDPGQRATAEGMQIRRLYLHSEAIGIAGFTDMVEEENGQLLPIEYKHGKEGKWLNDHIQLCAQAICLEELCPEQVPLSRGYIFYFGSRKRVQIELTQELRTKTLETIARAKTLLCSRQIPAPLDGQMAKRCQDCSLYALCLPEEVRLLKKG